MVYVLFADGFEEVEALYPIDILSRGGLNIRKISVTGDRTVVGTHGIAVVTDSLLDGIGDDIELLFLPGGMPGAATLDALPEMDALIEKTLKNGGRVAAICAAPMVLGKRGYLRDKRAVCYPGFEKFLDGACLDEERVVTDGRITTAVGMGAAGELGLTLLSLLRGEDAKERVAEAAFIKTSDLYETETLTPPSCEDGEIKFEREKI